MAGVESIDFVDTYSAAYRRDIFLANAGFDRRSGSTRIRSSPFG